MACGEFSLIARYFDRVRSSRLDVELGIGDDCALLNIPEKQTLAISTDTLVAGNHFLPDIDPADLAYKALAVNLSDLAAMGADPAWLTLALTLPDVDEAWLESFSDSLFDLLNYYDMQLIGGDTTRGPLSMTLGIHGFVPMGRALTRSGAKPGDWIDLVVLMMQLGKQQINSIWVEAGPTLAGALLQAGLVDELIVYIAPKLLGSDARGLCTLPGLEKLADAPQFKFKEIRHVGPDVCLHLVGA